MIKVWDNFKRLRKIDSKTKGLESIFMSKYSIIKVTSIKEVGNMDIYDIITIILTLTFFIIFSYYPKEAAKAQKFSLLNMGILITILFLLIFIIKGYSPIVAMQNYELISPIVLFGFLNFIFLITKYRLKKDDNWFDFKKLDLE